MNKLLLFLVFTTLLVSGGACTDEKITQQQIKPATITVNFNKVKNKVNPKLFGTNLQWVEGGDRMNLTKHSAKNTYKNIQQLGYDSIRFPGGALANTYLWKNTIGPQKKRKDGKNYIGVDEASIFGVDEFIELCAKSRVGAVITVNPKDSVKNTSDWVEYMNGNVNTQWGGARARHTSKSCYTKYWEIGNEVYSPNDPGFMSAEDYVSRVEELAKAMKNKDPDIQIGVVLEGSFLQAAWMKSVFPHLVGWNEDVLKILKGKDIDFVSIHFYAPFDKVWNDDTLSELVLSSSLVLRKNLQKVRELLEKYHPDLKIFLTEYGTFFGEKIRPSERIGGVEGGLFTAGTLLELMRSKQVTLANHWSLMNNSSFGSFTTENKKIVFRPSADVFRELSKFKNDNLVKTEVNSPSYRVDAIGNIPNLNIVPMVDAVAFKSDRNNYAVVIVNKSPSLKVGVKLVGFDPIEDQNLKFTTYNSNKGIASLTWEKNVKILKASKGEADVILSPGTFAVVKREVHANH